MTTGDVVLTILDGGAAAVVPGASVQVVMGPAAGGTVASPVATQSPNTLKSEFTGGSMPEAGALSALAGGTVIALRAATATAGKILGSDASPITITGATNASPIVVTATAHGLVTGAVVTQASVGGNTAANGTFAITRIDANSYSLNGSTGNGVYTSGGTAQPLGANLVATGTSEIYGTGVPTDDAYMKIVIVAGGTIGVAGITFKISYDAGRHYGPAFALGTASTYVLTGTGITLNFTAGTVVAADYVTIGCQGPLTDTAGIIACLTALKASAYGIVGWGTLEITSPFSAADAATINTAFNNLAGTDKIFTRVIIPARDASPPAIYGGTGESKAVWIAALQTDFSATDAKRTCVNAGYYNTPSAFPTALAGAPSYRRPLSWSLAARQVTIPPQRHAGRVRDGALGTVVVSPATDSADGFVYYDDRVDGQALDVARFCTARTRVKLPGYYITNPNLMSATGSVFKLLPHGLVMDVACGIVTQVGQMNINSDLRLNPNGTLYENEALAIENEMLAQLNALMTSANMISSASVVVNRTWNVGATSIVKISVTIVGRGYVLEEQIEIGYSNPLAAAA